MTDTMLYRANIKLLNSEKRKKGTFYVFQQGIKLEFKESTEYIEYNQIKEIVYNANGIILNPSIKITYTENNIEKTSTISVDCITKSKLKKSLFIYARSCI